MPKPNHARHIRDIEALTIADLPLRKFAPFPTSYATIVRTLKELISEVVKDMEAVKKKLLSKHFPTVKQSELHCGYHRGRRPFIGSIIWPDIVSVHHLHLHIIIKPHVSAWLFKYPSWLPLMWKSDGKVIRLLSG